MGIREAISAGMASIPTRLDLLPKVVSSVIDQVDRLYIFLNHYSEIPLCLKSGKIEIFRSQDHGNQSARGKFWQCEKISGYFFTLDDDIFYPHDYVKRMVSQIEVYKRRALLGVYAESFKGKDITNFYNSAQKKKYALNAALEKDAPVHIIGTGTLAYHTDAIRLKLSVFKTIGGVDAWLAIAAQQMKVPMITIARPINWLTTPKRNISDSIFAQRRRFDEAITPEIKKLMPWKLWEIK